MTSENLDMLYPILTEEKDSVIKKEVFNNLLDILVQNQSLKRNKIGNWECLSRTKETLQVSKEFLTSGQKSVDSSQTIV